MALSPHERELVAFESARLDLLAGAVTMDELAEKSGVGLGELETFVDSVESRAGTAEPVVGQRVRIPAAEFIAKQGLNG